MTGKELKEILDIKVKHALYREDGTWYHNLKEFPGVLLDKYGYVLFYEKSQYLEHPLLKIQKDLHVPSGIRTLKEYRYYTTIEKLYIESVFRQNNSLDERVLRIRREIDIILRDRKLVEYIKELYNNTCQICGFQIRINECTCYSEVHHIHPLGRPYNGVDNLNNMLCLCPNCHTILDFKLKKIYPELFKTLKHSLSEESINFHNNLCDKVKNL